MKKLKKNQMSGITLIALVVTIIVLLLLAGISIQMLTGDNGILNQAGEAKINTLHATVNEQMQLQSQEYLIDYETKETSDTLIKYLQKKEILGNEIGNGTWQIKIEKLLGTKQLLGNGDYTESSKIDVYVLESLKIGEKEIGKVASNNNVKLANESTTYEIGQFRIVYYGDENENKKIEIGLLNSTGGNEGNNELAKLQSYIDTNPQEKIEIIMQAFMTYYQQFQERQGSEGVALPSFALDDNTTAQLIGVFTGENQSESTFIIEYNEHRFELPIVAKTDEQGNPTNYEPKKIKETTITDYEIICKSLIEQNCEFFPQSSSILEQKNDYTVMEINGINYVAIGNSSEYTQVEYYKGKKISEIEDINIQMYTTDEGKNIYDYINYGKILYEDFDIINNNEDIITVEDNGVISGIDGGQATITLKGRTSGDTKTINVRVIKQNYV